MTRSGEFAFYYCECLTSTTIPDSVTKISYHAFDGCTNIQAAYNYAFIDELYKAINGNETTRSPAN